MGFVAWSVQNGSTIHVLFKLSAVTVGNIFICMAVSAVRAVEPSELGSHSNFFMSYLWKRSVICETSLFTMKIM